MILWISGQSGSGKSTLARHILGHNTVWLDGDELRKTISSDLGFSRDDRWTHNLRVARLARSMEEQGFAVIVSVICPYIELRQEIKKMINCTFLYLDGGIETDEDHPYEIQKDTLMFRIYTDKVKS